MEIARKIQELYGRLRTQTQLAVKLTACVCW